MKLQKWEIDNISNRTKLALQAEKDSNKMETTEGNKLIAEFMKHTGRNKLAHEFQRMQGLPNKDYHNSWDWLIPVVQKIDELGFNTQISRISVKISEILCEDKPIISLACGDLSQKNNLVWLAVCDFIKWYNEKNQ